MPPSPALQINTRAWRWVTVFVIGLAGCPFGGGGEQGPCRQDSLECGEGVAFEIDTSCENDDPLRVSLGLGDGSFMALLPGDDPPLEYGLQGGQHMVLGLRIDNADPDHLLFEVEVELEQDDGSGWTTVANRDVVYDEALLEVERTEAQILDMVLIPDVWDSPSDRVITVSVRDSCDRQTVIEHIISGD